MKIEARCSLKMLSPSPYIRNSMLGSGVVCSDSMSSSCAFKPLMHVSTLSLSDKILFGENLSLGPLHGVNL